MKNFISAILLVLLSGYAVGGTATLFDHSDSGMSAQGSGFINFASYNTTAITINVQANASGASQQGGGRNYRGGAEAVIGPLKDSRTEDPGSDPIYVSASLTINVTKHADGSWYYGGTNLGSGVSVSASAAVSGENAVGLAHVSATLSWTEPPLNNPPTISWNTSPGTVASGQTYTVSAHGHDGDGNLTQVNVWKNGTPFAFAGGGNGTDGDSGNATSDTGPTSITYTAEAVDSSSARSGTISHTVIISAPPAVAASISASPASATAPGSTTITWSSANASAVTVTGNGLNSTAASGTQTVSGLPVGTHTYTITAQGTGGPVSQTATFTVSAPTNNAPTIAWITTPGSVADGQSYTVSARGHDPDGNLTQVNIWKNGAPFAFAGGGNGTDGNSGNSTSDAGPATITFTANAVDALGATSGTISQTVSIAASSTVTASISVSPSSATAPGSTTVSWSSANATAVSVSGNGLSSSMPNGSQLASGLAAGTYVYTITAQGSGGPVTRTATFTVTAPSNAAPTVSWNLAPASVADGQNYTISAHAHDADGNLTQVNIWKNGTPFAFAGGGNGTNGDSSNSTFDSGPATITFAANAVDALGATSGTISHTVNVAAPLAVSASIGASPTSTTAPGSTAITWTSNNATSVLVSGTGLSNVAPSGTQTITGLAAGNYNYTITAQGLSGPAVQTVTVTVGSAATVSGAISTTPSTGTDPASTTVAWSSSNATSVVVAGPGLSSTAASGSQIVSGLSTGTYTYTLTAQGPGGPITRTANFTVTTAPLTVTGTLSVNPLTSTAPGATTISWTTANATSVTVSGPGLSSTAATGSQNVTGLPAGTHTFTLVAQGNGGPFTRSVNLTVNPGATVTGTITVSPTTMNVGGTATLTWSTANASSVRVTGYGVSGTSYQSTPSFTLNIGGLQPGQSTWTLVADGVGGPITRTATINVNSTDGLYGSLTVNPPTINSSQTANLAWTSSGANYRWIHGQLPGYNGVSVYPAPISGTTAVPALPPGEYSFIFEYGPGAFSGTRVAYAYLTVLGVNRTVTVASNPVGAGLATGSGNFAEGSSVTLTATPDSTHVFAGWSGDLTGTSNPLTFTVGAQNYSVTANFSLRTYTVAATVTPAGAGVVTGAGSYNVGTTATLTATPDAAHSFTGWTGDVSSAANPLTFTVNGNVSVVASFLSSSFALTTTASAGGSVTPGGTYPVGTIVTVAATPDSTHRFVDWSGDVSGTTSSTAVTMDRTKFVQANFTAKLSQTISFLPPGDHGLGSPPFALSASATSGLPVSFSLLSGPAILTESSVELTGVGPVTLQANQPGDAFFLPAPPVNQTFNSFGAATLKYRGASRTLLRDEATRQAAPYVLENP